MGFRDHNLCYRLGWTVVSDKFGLHTLEVTEHAMAERSHDTRTVSLWIKVTREVSDTPPHAETIYTNRHSHDLNRPEPWPIDDERLLHGVRYSFDIVTNVEREDREFYPGERRSYLRFEVTAYGSIEPPPGDVSITPVFQQCWLDEKTIDAGTWLRIGPLRRNERTFLDIFIQFAP
jgi:hypothetical protein